MTIPVAFRRTGNRIAETAEALLQGRTTYQVSKAAWPDRGGDPLADLGVQVCRYRQGAKLAE